MQIRRIWGFQETHETRTPKHSKSEEGRPLSCQALVRTAGGFFVLSTVHIWIVPVDTPGAEEEHV